MNGRLFKGTVCIISSDLLLKPGLSDSPRYPLNLWWIKYNRLFLLNRNAWSCWTLCLRNINIHFLDRAENKYLKNGNKYDVFRHEFTQYASLHSKFTAFYNLINKKYTLSFLSLMISWRVKRSCCESEMSFFKWKVI